MNVGVHDLDSLLVAIGSRASTVKRAPEGAPNQSPNWDHPKSVRATSGAKVDWEVDRDASSGPQSVGVATVAIITALANPELRYVLDVFGTDWKRESREGIVYQVTTLAVGGDEVQIVAAAQNEMGMVAAAILATKTITAWDPRIIVMTGVCAGVRGKVEVGDVVVGQQLFDYGSGKLEAGNVTPDYQPVTLSDSTCSCVSDLAAQASRLAEIRSGWPTEGGKPATELRAYLGAMASGAAVVGDDAVVQGIKQHKRSLLAVDMEAYGIGKAAASSLAPPVGLVVKGVQDFADESKDDDYREYAAYVSAAFVRALVVGYPEVFNPR